MPTGMYGSIAFGEGPYGVAAPISTFAQSALTHNSDITAIFTVDQTIDNIRIDRISNGKYSIAGLEMDKPPQFSFDVMNPSGIEMYKCFSGKEIAIKRNNILEMPGIIETPEGQEGDSPTKVTVSGIHKGYHLLRAAQCTAYDFDEDGSPHTTRDAVTVNSWETFILRKEDGALDAFGNTQPIDGISFNEYVEHLLGTKFAYQHQFVDNTHLLASQTFLRGSGTNKLFVYRDGPTGDKTPALQRVRDGATFKAGASVESIPLYNNDRNVRQMGQINSSSVLIIGQRVTTVVNPVLGAPLATCTGEDSDVSGNGRNLTFAGSPGSRTSGQVKYGDGIDLDGTNDKATSTNSAFKDTGEVSYFWRGVIDTLPASGKKWVLGGWTDSGDANKIPWLLYVDSAGVITYTHKSSGTAEQILTGATISAGTEFGVSLIRTKINIQIRKDQGTFYNTAFDQVNTPAGSPAGGNFVIGRDDIGAVFNDGGVFEARFWSRDVDNVMVAKIADPADIDYRALIEGTEAAAWFMCGETNPGSTTVFTGSDPTLELCRNAISATRTYTSVTLTRTSNYLGSGLEAWTGSITFSGSETVKNTLGYRITLPGSGGDIASTKLFYIKLIAGTTANNGVTAGTIATYANPIAINGEENWIATDMLGYNVLEALERVRKLTEASESVNPSPNWDMWVDNSMRLHFVHRRGSLVPREYSFAQKNLRKIGHEYFGGELAFQTIALGAGAGVAQTSIVSKQEYSAGGLYDVNRDPAGGTRLYGDLPRILQFKDPNETSPVALLRKARTYHRLHRDPIENLKVEIHNEAIPYFSVGDSVTLKNLKTRTNNAVRIIELRRSWSGSGSERVELEVGQKFVNGLFDSGANAEKMIRTLALRNQPAQATLGISGDGIHCTKDKFGVFPFVVQDGSIIDRVILQITTVPWQVEARGGVSETHTHLVGDHTVSQGGSGSNTGFKPFTFGLYEATWTAPQASFTNFQNAFSPTVAASAELDYVEILLGTWNQNTGTHETTPEFRVIRNNGDFNGEVVASQTNTGVMSSVPVQFGTFGDGEDTIFTHFRVSLYKATAHPILPTDTFRLQYKNTNGSYTDEAMAYITFFYQHNHTVQIAESGAHVHKLEHGIYQYDGDFGNGDGSPVYGSGIRLAVDPQTVSQQGVPTNFDAERMSTKFGNKVVPQSIQVDVTGYMTTEGNGVIINGEHKAYLLAEAGDSTGQYANTKGLASVVISVIFKFKGV